MHHTGPCSQKSTMLLSYFILAKKWKGKKYHVLKNQQVTFSVLSNIALPEKWEDMIVIRKSFYWSWWRLFRSILLWWPGQGAESLLLSNMLPREGGPKNSVLPSCWVLELSPGSLCSGVCPRWQILWSFREDTCFFTPQTIPGTARSCGIVQRSFRLVTTRIPYQILLSASLSEKRLSVLSFACSSMGYVI